MELYLQVPMFSWMRIKHMNKFPSTGIQMLFWKCIVKSIHWLQYVLSENKTRREDCSITVNGVGSEHQVMSAAVEVPLISDWYRGVKGVCLNYDTSSTLMTWSLSKGASLLGPLQQDMVHKVSQSHFRDRQFLLRSFAFSSFFYCFYFTTYLSPS